MPTAKLSELQEELRAVLAEIREGHRSLAEEPDFGGARERALLLAIQNRDRLAREVGCVVVGLVARGETVSVAASPQPAAAPEPAAPSPPPVPASPAPPPPRVVAAPAPAPEPERVAPPVRPPPTVVPPSASVAPRAVPVEPRRAPSRPPRAPRTLRQTLAVIGPPRAVESVTDAVSTIERVVDACDDPDEWLQHTTEVQRCLVGLTSSLARHVQDEADLALPPTAAGALGTWFSAMTRWSKLYRPGFVAGLSRANRPERASWIDDAHMWWDVLSGHLPLGNALGASLFASSGPGSPPAVPVEPPAEVPSVAAALRALEAAVADPEADLGPAVQAAVDAGLGQRDQRLVALLLPHRERVARIRGLKTLKSALKFARSPEGDGEVPEVEEVSAIPEDWPFLPFTAEADAVVVGGDPRQEHADRMRDAFRFGSVSWNEIDPRRVDALASRIRSGTHGFVVVLREFVSHSVADAVIAACKDVGVSYVVVDTGYGVNQVRLATERYLRGRLE